MGKASKTFIRIGKVTPLLLLGSFFIPETASADAISIAIIAFGGIAIIIPITVAISLLEGYIIGRYLNVAYGDILVFSFFANIISSIAGVPVKAANVYIDFEASSKSLYDSFVFYPWMFAFGVVLYFIVTITTEYPAILWLGRKRAVSFEKEKLFHAVLISNIVTYVLLTPLYYYSTRPIHDISQFTQDTKWARKPYTRLIYVDEKTKQLQSIDTNGNNISTLIPHEVKDYLLSKDIQYSVFRGEGNNLFAYDFTTKKRTLLAKPTNEYFMNQVAISPGGETIAFLKLIGEYNIYRLILFQPSQGIHIETNYITGKDTWRTAVAWSSLENLLYIKEGKVIYKVTLSKDSNTVKHKVGKSEKLDVHLDYGRNNSSWSDADDWGSSYSISLCKKRKIGSSSGFDSSLYVWENKRKILKFADNSGLLHLSNRPIEDALLLPNCEEAIFNDQRSIYLLDIHNKKIGEITQGERFITISERYSKLPLFTKEEEE
ncbi:MAG: hypothetical protein HQK84_08720 [Nitrospinae bacterium]|nr:hypothetical protein [Nitrospinota bacterium]